MARGGRSALLGKSGEGVSLFRTHSEMPSVPHLSRRMVELRNLKIPIYDAEVVEVYDLDGTFSTLYDTEADKAISQMEIRPIEAEYSLRFIDTLNAKRLPALPLFNVRDIKVVSHAKGLFKRKDQMLEMTFLGSERKIYVAKINFDDKYIYQILDSIQKLKQLESDATYWARD